jgi:UDP-hydrolysing UDP-N-acetyl-D-glucosamine 2-epimerase
MSPAPLLVTFHPATLEPGRAEDQCAELLAALDGFDRPKILTSPNADAGGRAIAARIADYVRERPDAWLIDNAGNDGYFSLMAHAAAMVGNSSSGLVESPSFRVPVVNIGTRQQGRLRARNVIDVGNTRSEIAVGIQSALSPSFRASLATLINPYGKGHAARAIVDVLRKTPLDDALIRKRFQEPIAETAAR